MARKLDLPEDGVLPACGHLDGRTTSGCAYFTDSPVHERSYLQSRRFDPTEAKVKTKDARHRLNLSRSDASNCFALPVLCGRLGVLKVARDRRFGNSEPE